MPLPISWWSGANPYDFRQPLVKPYYDDGRGIVIYHGDCRSILPHLPKVDLVLTDPPYGVGFNYDGKRDFDISWVPSFVCGIDANKCVTPGIDNVCSWPQPRWILAWIKSNSMGPNRLSGPATVSRNLWEPILWYGGYPSKPLTRDIVYAPTVVQGNGHPCPKPLPLFTALASMASETILDPFMGSGTTLRAAKDLGRRAIGIEIEERYCEIAARRLAQEVLAL